VKIYIFFALVMKKKIIKLGTLTAVIAIGVSVLALGGCKDETPAPKVPTTSERICANTWEISALPIEPPLDLGGGIKLTDYTQMMQDCEKDNYMKFTDANGKKTYVSFEGLLKCDPADPDTTMGNWGLSADEKIFDLDGDKFKLVLIDDNNFHVRMDSFLQNSSITFKFKKRP
jgi:hypothetical protein